MPTTHHQQIAAKIKVRAADDKQQAACQTTKSKTLHDANLWLWMARWARYLAGVYFQDVLDIVATPDQEQEDPVSQAILRMWDAMLQLA
jgi:type III secretory pathway component EscU